jgi:UrcA family protein
MFNLIEKATGFGLLALAALPIVSLGAAHAETVKVSDLDLRQPAQAAVFEQRLDRAATRICSGRVLISDLTAMSVCKRAVRAEAMDKLTAHEQMALRAATVKVASR